MADAIRIVSATRSSAEAFESRTALGRSLAVLRRAIAIQTRISLSNAEGLPVVYNRAIAEAKDDPATLVFVHDDVYIADTMLVEELRRCLSVCQIVGLAGNKRRVLNQPGWAFTRIDDGRFVWDDADNLSGVVGHGEPPGTFSLFGPVHQECVLLDGLFLAADSTVLIERGLGFDPRFEFHFYDMDFCRQAELKRARMCTASVKVIHRSGGAFGTPAWSAAYRRYLEKYGG